MHLHGSARDPSQVGCPHRGSKAQHNPVSSSSILSHRQAEGQSGRLAQAGLGTASMPGRWARGSKYSTLGLRRWRHPARAPPQGTPSRLSALLLHCLLQASCLQCAHTWNFDTAGDKRCAIWEKLQPRAPTASPAKRPTVPDTISNVSGRRSEDKETGSGAIPGGSRGGPATKRVWLRLLDICPAIRTPGARLQSNRSAAMQGQVRALVQPAACCVPACLAGHYAAAAAATPLRLL